MSSNSVQRILDQDDLVTRLSEIAETKPRDIIFAWYDDEKGVTRTCWFGAWPMDIGLARMLLLEIEKPADGGGSGSS
ncbi:MAG: hypothetical protein A2Y91_00265 [Chloroflexi bacterium RBG_13_54_8]|nr:MAG: hypothetical protein A2Y91_00265 [Chloroflexi bacterium RBG_13_54_8]